MEHFTRLVVFLVFLLISAAIPVTVAAAGPIAAPREYSAVYEVQRKGERVANVTLELSRQDDTWSYRGFTHDMRGLGKLLHARGEQVVTGTFQDGIFQPDEFRFSFSVVGFKSRWGANFDWPAGTVTVGKKSRMTTLPLAGGAMDPMSLFLNTGSLLSEGQTQMAINVIDEDEIENHLYEAQPGILLNTPLGCLETTQVKRIRENSKRTSLAWYAPDFGYIPVQLHHFRKNDIGMQMKIISLSINGQQIALSDSCPVDTGTSISG
ncbi:MAG: DUF3108 domain-containing protein [Xanthomonadales bacterium]|nr:DUF3108 domain-containing protein [Xanthomonadales bacterium]